MPDSLLTQLAITPAQIFHLSGNLRSRVLNFLLRWEAWQETLNCLDELDTPNLVTLQDMQAEVLVGDLAEPGTLHGLGREVAGPLDSLVHCAGVVTLAPLATARLDDWHRQLDVNLVAPAVLTREFVPHLRQSRGRLVAVSSLAGLYGVPGRTAYSTSKFAMNGFFESLRVELSLHGVSVTVAYPGVVTTEIRSRGFNAHGQPLGTSSLDERGAMSVETTAHAV